MQQSYKVWDSRDSELEAWNVQARDAAEAAKSFAAYIRLSPLTVDARDANGRIKRYTITNDYKTVTLA